ncbi:ribbon-helix-helix domain-containing protein [Vibrio sp. CAU 1672]|uniref:ribbon-helix-helix domain-containing protein n=1 Tax=Vibrio sp. CAU 1672 TaxID=3032594 RepID=UPI0023DAC875|nr:ribbon-helix-helix domain-containing protein [Vibrio sp. CAU 1672]MDF2153809.1 ribbon-helix-helix domain-containing protein [Vibrio sp. CAU 1672]
MCEIFAKQPQENYQFITRSIRINGHATSVKLESSFWAILEQIADAQAMSVPKFISTVYQEALQHNGEVTNFASLLRCACLTYARQPHATIRHALAENNPPAS